MMNFSFQLREPNGLVIPKGPDFAFARTILTDIDGTKLNFKAPKHQPRRSSHEPIFPAPGYKSEEIYFRENRVDNLKVSYDWRSFALFEHSWIFNGPWFTGTRAYLGMYVNLLKPINYPNSNISLFNPHAFEQMIGDYLTYRFAGIRSDINDKCYYMGPIDWHPYNELDIFAARLKVVTDQSVITQSPRHYLFFPIADNLVVAMCFITNQLVNMSPQEERDKRVSTSTMHELMENIIDSLQVKLSPEAIAQQQAAVKGLEDVSLVKEYPPFNWNGPEFLAQTLKQIDRSSEE